MKYKAVLFDLDGTLLDTLDDLTDSVNFAMDSMGWQRRERAEVRLFLGNGIRRLMELCAPKDISGDEFEMAFGSHSAYLRSITTGTIRIRQSLMRVCWRLWQVLRKKA